jgi:ATP:corrinoid adenosyltransferase
VAVVASALIAISFSGCAAAVVGAGAGVGTYAYAKGEMKSVEQATMDKAWNAVEKTVKDMGFVVESQSHDALISEIEARGAGDKKITNKLTFF